MHITAYIIQLSYINNHVIITGVSQRNIYLEIWSLTTTTSVIRAMVCSTQQSRLKYNGRQRRIYFLNFCLKVVLQPKHIVRD